MNILFLASEAFPLIKTGGLADVAGALPRALIKRGHSLRLVLPAYQSVLARLRSDDKAPPLSSRGQIELDGTPVKLWQTRLPGTRVTVWLVDIPAFSEREGNPYVTPEGVDWPDNDQRFYTLCRAATELAMGRAGINWKADLVHANDWQGGMVCQLLAREASAPATVFTIHNLAYHGLFDYQTMHRLGLEPWLWQPDFLEFYGQLSFIKAGLVFAQRLTTVSPSYAQEIQTPELGCGLDGLLRARQEVLSGIINGIDTQEWNPARDASLAAPYDRRRLARKADNKKALCTELGLADKPDTLLLGFIGRLVEQKGLDLLLATLPELLARGDVQIALLGSGVKAYEQAFAALAKDYPEQLSVTLGYNETLAHRIEAGVDVFLMPSLFEPCGLNQMYSLRYGTLPLVHAVGGLKDTVIDGDDPLTVNGFCFEPATVDALRVALKRALALYQDPEAWQQRQRNAMSGDYSWDRSAAEYERIYELALEDKKQNA
ncbi:MULTISPECIES: glycogen synthase GlgA [unclassified Marinimicrobium]|jgi:starch synthase|uniref:glycogen synthase GlgA n=1 Tax=unclassified Marinimicrobium TaxID=2632100 RepID=UPI00257BEE69|nr:MULTISPECIES: glycogen synthase GlgA [unclassified Marinimicrobium]